MEEIILGTIIVLAAGIIQGLTSFGFALITIPLFIRFIPLQEAVPLVLMLCLETNLIIIANCIKHVRIKRIWILIVSSLIFVPVGAYFLMYFNPDYIKVALGVIIVVFSVILFFGKSFPIKNEKIGYSVAGSLSGFLNGSLSLGGPPVILFLSNQGMDKQGFRANFTFYFIVINLLTIASFLKTGILNKLVMERLLFLTPALIVSVLAGIKLSKKVNEKLFKKITLILLIVTGLWTLINAVRDILVA